MNVLLLSMPDSFEHMPPVAIRMPNGALTSLAGNVDPQHRVAVADLILVHRQVRETVTRLVRELDPEVVGFSIMTFQRRTAARIIGLVRSLRQGVKIVVGGYDPSRALMGAVLGGFIFGTLSDHFGRIRVLTGTILIFAAFTGLCAFARGYWRLVACRVIAGLGLGGEFGIGMTLAAEAWPASKRARASSYVSLGWQSGVLMAALVTPKLLPIIGWRGMFLVGLLPALVAFIVRRTLHEPEIFVKKRHCRVKVLWIASLLKVFGAEDVSRWIESTRCPS